MTSHRHPPIHSSLAAQREHHQRMADHFERIALRNEQQAEALRGCLGDKPRQRCEHHASFARRCRRTVRHHLTQAAELTDWLDDLDRKAGNWIEPLVALYEATRPAPHPTPYAQAA